MNTGASPAQHGRREPRTEGWVFVPPDRVPRKWRERAIQVALVPLSPEEAAELLESPRPSDDVDPVDENLARLTAQGLTVTAMARRLNLSPRSVNRRLARLRQRFGVGSTAELAVELARRGF